MSSIIIAVLLVAVNCINDRPIIGIIAQPHNANSTYIAASYVKWIESAGARVVPIPFNVGKDRLKILYQSVNGLLFPGGGTSLDGTPYMHALEYLFELALEDNKKGVYFPIWATCLGFEAVNAIVARDIKILTWGYDAHNISWPLDLLPAASKSRMFSGAPTGVLEIIGSKPVTMNNHQGGVLPETFKANKYLTEFFDLLSVNKDKKGKPFVSTIEGKKYPIYATQWHPEKQAFEFKIDEMMNHSFESIIANQWVANFFVNEARKNEHRFTNASEEAKALIYNYTPVYTGLQGSDFVQTYFFANPK